MLPAMNPFAMLLDSTAAIQAHENVLSSLRKQVHKRADALPRHLEADVVEFDTAIEMAAGAGAVSAGRGAKAPVAAKRKAAPTPAKAG